VDLIRIRMTVNNVHKHMTPDEVAADLQRYMQATSATQHVAAEFFGLSPGYVSKLLAPSKRLLPELKHLADNPAVPRDVLRIVAGMGTLELQKKLAERVLADVAREGKANRDAIQLAADEMKSGKKSKDRPLFLKGEGGIDFKAKKPTPESIRAFIDKLAVALKRLAGGDINDLPFHFRTS
jgi:hypothetical protein